MSQWNWLIWSHEACPSHYRNQVSPDSWPGNSIWSPASGWLVKLAPPILRSWGKFLKRIAGWHPEKSPDGFLPEEPRKPRKGTCCAGKAILGKAASLGGNQVLYVKSGSHRDLFMDLFIPPSLPGGRTVFHRCPGVKASYVKCSWGWCSFSRQPGLHHVWLLYHHPPVGQHFGTDNQP